MRICRDCLDVTIKSCYFCSIGQQILEECKCTKTRATSKKSNLKNNKTIDYKELSYLR